MCLPPWFVDIVLKGRERVCVGCDKVIHNSIGIQTLIIPCIHRPKRVHFNAVPFHSNGNCVSKFHQEMPCKQAKSFDVMPGPWKPKTKYVLETFRSTCLKNHVFDGSRCENCETRGEIGNIKLKTCGGCKQVRYCTSKCQREDWESHREFCKKQSVYRKNRRNKRQSRKHVPLGNPCSCFSPEEMITYKRQGNMCSYHGCNNIVTNWETPRSAYVAECTNDGDESTHIMSTSYCCNKCQRKNMTK